MMDRINPSWSARADLAIDTSPHPSSPVANYRVHGTLGFYFVTVSRAFAPDGCAS